MASLTNIFPLFKIINSVSDKCFGVKANRNKPTPHLISDSWNTSKSSRVHCQPKRSDFRLMKPAFLSVLSESSLSSCSCIDSWSKVKPCCPEHPFDWLTGHTCVAQWPTRLRYVHLSPHRFIYTEEFFYSQGHRRGRKLMHLTHASNWQYLLHNQYLALTNDSKRL